MVRSTDFDLSNMNKVYEQSHRNQTQYTHESCTNCCTRGVGNVAGCAVVAVKIFWKLGNLIMPNFIGDFSKKLCTPTSSLVGGFFRVWPNFESFVGPF